MRGRKPKPTRIKQLNGNPGKRPLNENEPKPQGELSTPPSFLSPAAVTIWNEALTEAPPGLLTSVDSSVLANYCTWRATFEQAATEMLQRGSVSASIRGERKVAPEVMVMHKASTNMMRACTEMGFTPSSRGRMHVEAPKGEGNEFADV